MYVIERTQNYTDGTRKMYFMKKLEGMISYSKNKADAKVFSNMEEAVRTMETLDDNLRLIDADFYSPKKYALHEGFNYGNWIVIEV